MSEVTNYQSVDAFEKIDLVAEKGRDAFHNQLVDLLSTSESYDYLPHGDWYAGGCCLLAQALLPLLKGANKLLMVGRKRNGVITDHMVIETFDGLFIDRHGIQSWHELSTRMKEECFIQGDLFVAEPNLDVLVSEGVIDPHWNISGFRHFLIESLGSF